MPSNLPARHFSVTELRQMALDAAGFTPESIGELVRAGVDKLLDKLSATKVSYFAFEGVVTDERVTQDHMAQIKAAEGLIAIGADMAALRRKVKEDAQPKPVAPSINLVGWTLNVQPPPPVVATVDVTPESAS